MLYSFTPVNVICTKLLYLFGWVLCTLSTCNLLLGNCSDSSRISSDYEFASKRFVTKTKYFTHKISFRGLFPEGIDKLTALQVLIWLVGWEEHCWQYSVFKWNLKSYKAFMLWFE